ncbi:MAG: helix-turn-helix domain-containing protein [Planctomycetaceae bacterium]|nr:helix-turn-helix domain-containing protein [Planctomycetales bacterium]MCB9924278.1 helix-turn-helix domain-containing protein [Planctomycetaceae bacterium]
MANQLSMAQVHTIESLHKAGYSNRRIAQTLGVDRGTVSSDSMRLISFRYTGATWKSLLNWLKRFSIIRPASSEIALLTHPASTGEAIPHPAQDLRPHRLAAASLSVDLSVPRCAESKVQRIRSAFAFVRR